MHPPDSSGKPSFPTEPSVILDSVWNAVVRGKADRRHPFHHPALATVSADGTPAVRTVVLRHADRDAPEIGCHTDARSPKVAEIAVRPTTSWLLYDPGARLQLRVSGPTRVLTSGPEHAEAWRATRVFSRRCYLAPHAPSTAAEGPDPNLPADLIDANPSAERSEQGRDAFAVVRTSVASVEWLHLAAAGHARGRFVYTGKDWTHEWLRP
jgi:pyridoxamine 5'-phosphate oxidase